MNYTWNVYKLFKNGRRTKLPITTFEYDDEEKILEYFESQIKDKFNENLKYMVIRSDKSQIRNSDVIDVDKEKFTKNKNRVIKKHLINKNIILPHNHVVGGLILCKQSNWKWQWAIMESGTSQYIVGLSPSYKSFEDAGGWMKGEIDKL